MPPTYLKLLSYLRSVPRWSWRRDALGKTVKSLTPPNAGNIGCLEGDGTVSASQRGGYILDFPKGVAKMDLGGLPIFKMITTKMDWLARRQRVLAQNVANADTPGYTPQDLEKIDFKDKFRRESFRLQLTTTNSDHIQSGIRQTVFGDIQDIRESYETSPTGNAVILEEQLIKVADTAAAHQLATSLYRKNVGLFRIALGRQTGQ